MKTLAYCVLVGTLAFLWLNGGEDADITTWALSLVGIITSVVMMATAKEKETT